MLQCDAAKVKPGLKGNLIVNISAERAGAGQPPARLSRHPAGRPLRNRRAPPVGGSDRWGRRCSPALACAPPSGARRASLDRWQASTACPTSAELHPRGPAVCNGSMTKSIHLRGRAAGGWRSPGRRVLGLCWGHPRPVSKGIYQYRFDPGSGKVTPLGVAAVTVDPAFFAVHPNRRILFVANEYENPGEAGNTISSFAIDAATGKLTFLNKISAKGDGPCYIVVDKTGKNLLLANFGSGSVAVLPIAVDGRLGEATAFIQHAGSSVNPDRQKGPHAHCIILSPDNRFALVSDLGLDKVLVYRFDAAKGTLAPNDPPFTKVAPGAGSRHLVFHPNGKIVYCISEMASSHDHLRIRGERRDAERDPNGLDAARGLQGEQHGGRGASESRGDGALRVEPRARQHRGVLDRSAPVEADAESSTFRRRERRHGISGSIPPGNTCSPRTRDPTTWWCWPWTRSPASSRLRGRC